MTNSNKLNSNKYKFNCIFYAFGSGVGRSGWCNWECLRWKDHLSSLISPRHMILEVGRVYFRKLADLEIWYKVWCMMLILYSWFYNYNMKSKYLIYNHIEQLKRCLMILFLFAWLKYHIKIAICLMTNVIILEF